MTCPLCTDRAKSEIWRNGNFYLIDAEDPAFPCFLRVVSCRHVPEMSSLTSEERTHLHWHVIARWQDDSHFPECPWGPVQRDVPADVQAERRRMTEALKPVLREALEKRFGC